MAEWTKEDFSRRHYTYESGALDKAKKIEVQITVDGKLIAQLQCREPGVLAVISKPDEPGVHLDLLEPCAKRYSDLRVPGGYLDEEPATWQFEALGVR